MRPGRALVAALLWTALALIVAPLVYSVWLSFTPGNLLAPPVEAGSLRWYRAFFDDGRWTGALVRSVLVALGAAAIAIGAGLGLALAVVRHRLAGARWLSAAVVLPLFTPQVVLGMALLPFMRTIGLWGHIGSLAIAHALIALPVVYLVLRDALADLDFDLEAAARGLGASPAVVFSRVTLPLIAPALAAGGLVAFILSLNEFVIALFVATPAIETLPRVIWPSLRYTLTPLVAAASALSLVVTVMLLAVAVWLARRRHG